MLNSINRLIGLVYDRLPKKVQDEITVSVAGALVAVNIVQETALPLAPAVHTAILIVTVLAGALGVRGSVTPLSKQ